MANKKNESLLIETKTEKKSKEINIEEIKTELKTYIDERVKIEASEYIKEYNREVLKPKKRKILWLKFIIFLLIILYIGSFAFLVKDHYFDKYIIKIEEKLVKKENKDKPKEDKEKKQETEDNKKKEEEKKKEEQEKAEKAKQERINALKEKYKNIFQHITITTNNNYKNDYYSGKFSNNFYLSLGVELLSNEDFTKEENIISLNADKLMDKVKTVTNQTINHDTFTFKDVTFSYIKSLNTYILDKELVKDGIQIEREIINIEEKNTIVIDTIEYYVKDNKKYNPVTDELITEGAANNNKFMAHEFIFENGEYYLIK